MDLVITDNKAHYDTCRSAQKILFTPYQFIGSDLLEKESLLKLNISLANAEYEAADRMLQTLKVDCERSKNENFRTNRFQETRKPYDRAYSLLYPAYWNLLIPAYGLALAVKRLLDHLQGSGHSVQLHVSSKYQLCEEILKTECPGHSFSFRYDKAGQKKLARSARNAFYFTYDKLMPAKKNRPALSKEQKHIVLFLYDIPSVHMVMKRFIKMVQERADLFLSIIELTTGSEAANRASANSYASKNIAVYPFQEFRTRIPDLHADLYSKLKEYHPGATVFEKYDPLYDAELRYAWTNKCIRKLQPDIALYLGVLEQGRAISDVCRYHKVPTVNIDYAIFTDDPLYMESNIQFDHRACVSQNSIDTWKRRGDPTKDHVVTGFCKLDEARSYYPGKLSFFTQHKLDPQAKTVCFASTWSGHTQFNQTEKEVLIEKLSDMCAENKWNLVIKKHPAESDTIAEDRMAAGGHAHQAVLPNASVNLYELLSYCDVVCTQSSGIVNEAFYLGKPFCFISLNPQSAVITYTPLAAEKGIKTFHAIEDLSVWLKEIFIPGKTEKYMETLAGLKEKYLFKTDGRATQRLFDLVLRIIS